MPITEGRMLAYVVRQTRRWWTLKPLRTAVSVDGGGNGQTVIDMKLAETGGFEPPIRCDPYNGLANRRLQPLGHVSGDGTSVSATSSTVKHPDGRPGGALPAI